MTGAQLRSKLFIGNTLFVAKSGNNATALRNRWDKPFATVLEAKNNAQVGDTIYVFPGTYNEGSADITASGVQYWVEDGAIIQCNVEVISDFGLAKDIWVDGAGTFQTLGINFGRGVVNVNNVASTLYFRGKQLLARTNGAEITAHDPNVNFDFHCDTITCDLQYGLFLSGNVQGIFSFNLIETQDSAGIFCSNVGTDLVKRRVFIKGVQMTGQSASFGAGLIATQNCFNTEIHWEGITLNHFTSTAGGGFLIGGGFNYFINCNLKSENGYGVNFFSGQSVNRWVNCNIVSERQAFNSNGTSINEIVGGVYSSSDDGLANVGSITLSGSSELDIQDAVIEQTATDGVPAIIRVDNDNLRIGNIKMVGDASITQSIRGNAPRNIKVEKDSATNKAVDGNITNLVAGTTIVVDSNVGRNSQTVF